LWNRHGVLLQAIAAMIAALDRSKYFSHGLRSQTGPSGPAMQDWMPSAPDEPDDDVEPGHDNPHPRCTTQAKIPGDVEEQEPLSDDENDDTQSEEGFRVEQGRRYEESKAADRECE
jgi:hypothetical protein